jgi:uncharacterized protein (TIGR03435 family)
MRELEMKKTNCIANLTTRIVLVLLTTVTWTVAQQPPATSESRPAIDAASIKPLLRFEVASIRLHVSGSGTNPSFCSGDRFTSIGVGFGNVLGFAYELTNFSEWSEFVQRIPRSIRGNVYDIQAKAASPVTKSQCRLMLQALLADRFKIAIHSELKDAEISELVVARGGPKIRKALATDDGSDVNLALNGRLFRSEAPLESDGSVPKGLTMQLLAEILTSRMGIADPGVLRQIVDKTGLEGRYKIDLRFSTTLAADSQDPADPPLDAALAQQLGLRLERRKGSVQVHVLDHIEPPDPSAN